MSKHFEKLRNSSINALLRAQERLRIENLYNPSYMTKDALELVDVALSKLTEVKADEAAR